jgi:hypothetical protein
VDWGFIFLLSAGAAVSYGEAWLRKRRVLGILLLPILAFVFLVGWIMYVLGRTRARQKPQKNESATNRDAVEARENELETGLMAQTEEEPLTTK